MYKFFFPLRNGYYYGKHLNKLLRDRLGKQLVQDSHATGLLCQTVLNSGDGDYIEIGSLHGGSAITSALTKKEFNLNGRVLCIDPSPRNIRENAKLFGVENLIDIIVAPSNEVTFNISSYSCGFIDGDHRDPRPMKDFVRLKRLVSKYIIFDDYDKSELGVEVAVRYAMQSQSNWRPVHISDAIAIFEKEIE